MSSTDIYVRKISDSIHNENLRKILEKILKDIVNLFKNKFQKYRDTEIIF